MRQDELIREVAARSGLSAQDARAVLDAATELICARVGAGEVVPLPGLGRLAPVWRKERVIRGVADGRKLALDGHWDVEFRPGRELRETLESRSPRLLKTPEHQAAWRLAEALAADLRNYFPQARLEISPDSTPEQVASACLLAYGAAWSRARSRFDHDVPESVRAQRDYLILAVRRRARA